MKQTAVEWLINRWKKLQSEQEKMTWNQIIQITELAKEMFEQQIVDAYNQGWNDRGNDDGDYKQFEDAEQYYHETFKTK